MFGQRLDKQAGRLEGRRGRGLVGSTKFLLLLLLFSLRFCDLLKGEFVLATERATRESEPSLIFFFVNVYFVATTFAIFFPQERNLCLRHIGIMGNCKRAKFKTSSIQTNKISRALGLESQSSFSQTQACIALSQTQSHAHNGICR